MSEQTTVAEFGDAQSTEDGGEQKVVFRLTNDPLINYAAATIAAQAADTFSVTGDRIAIDEEVDTETAIQRIEGIIEDGLETTHRRTSLAHSVNAALDEQGAANDDARRIKSPTMPFPENDTTQTIYDQDRLAATDVTDHDLNSEYIDKNNIDGESLFTQAPSYVGTNRSDFFPNQREKFEDAFAAFAATLRESASVDEKSCMCCGSDAYPAYDNPVTDEKLEYNQTFAPLTSTGGQVRALGTGSRNNSHRGRCAACLVTGFYFAVMPKIFRQTNISGNNSRIFVPSGDFTELYSIASDLYLNNVLSDMDEPVGDDRANSRQQTLGRLNTRSLGMQAIDIYQRVVRHLFAEYEGGILETEISYRPTELLTFVSELGQTREITRVERIDPSAPIYELLESHQRADDSREYWPADDILKWFAETDGSATRNLIEAKDELAEGIIDLDLGQIRHGIVAIYRSVERAGGENTPGYARPHPGDLHHYFSSIMQQATQAYDQIESTEIESIQRVASALGRVFSGGDDVSVLINLQNASTQDEFLRAFEKAGMQAQKKSTDEPPQKFDAARDDDVADVLELLTDQDTFEPTKRMFVIHASLAAQYENAVSSSGGDDDE